MSEERQVVTFTKWESQCPNQVWACMNIFRSCLWKLLKKRRALHGKSCLNSSQVKVNVVWLPKNSIFPFAEFLITEYEESEGLEFQLPVSLISTRPVVSLLFNKSKQKNKLRWTWSHNRLFVGEEISVWYSPKWMMFLNTTNTVLPEFTHNLTVDNLYISQSWETTYCASLYCAAPLIYSKIEASISIHSLGIWHWVKASWDVPAKRINFD